MVQAISLLTLLRMLTEGKLLLNAVHSLLSFKY